MSDDSYLLLVSTEESPKRLHHKMYLWHGADCSMSDNAVAVRKAAELFKSIEGECEQSREFQGKESNSFLDLFRSVGGVRYVSANSTNFAKPPTVTHEGRVKAKHSVPHSNKERNNQVNERHGSSVSGDFVARAALTSKAIAGTVPLFFRPFVPPLRGCIVARHAFPGFPLSPRLRSGSGSILGYFRLIPPG